MIFIDRQRVPCPSELNGPTSKGVMETAKATAHFADETTRKSPFTFTAYKQESVKLAVSALTLGKCAYCESPYGATQPVDIEHYRPKSAVLINRKLTPPGYYWLAASWDNLLPCCIHCNRPGTHETGSSRVTAGKASWFPLVDETRRASKPGAEANEEPLLLHPCKDRPEQHLEFDADGAVRAKKDPQTGIPSARGQATIDICALRRVPLARARAERAILVTAQIERVKATAQDVVDFPDTPRFGQRLEQEIKVLQAMVAAETPYAALSASLAGGMLQRG